MYYVWVSEEIDSSKNNSQDVKRSEESGKNCHYCPYKLFIETLHKTKYKCIYLDAIISCLGFTIQIYVAEVVPSGMTVFILYRFT